MDIKKFIQGLDIKTFVEVGAHFGLDTRDFRAMHPSARIVCFEPDPRNILVLRTEGIDSICELHEIALSDKNGPATFHLSSGTAPCPVNGLLRTHDWSCSSSLKAPTGHLDLYPMITFPTSVTVECVKLDEFAPLLNTKIDFMWVDVQGAEDLVFAGAQETIKNTHYIFTEYSNRPLYDGQISLERLKMLVGPNFRLVHDFGDDVLLENLSFVR